MRAKDITVKNVQAFAQGNIRHLHPSTMPPHQAEQVKYRAKLCDSCLQAGKCTVCGCRTPQLFYAPNKKDAAGK